MNASIAVRRGTSRDRAFVSDLGRRVSPTSVSSLREARPKLVELAYDRLLEFAWTRDHALLIAEDDGVPMGFALAFFDLPEEITLDEQVFIAYMAVEPAVQRRGIGRALLAQIEDLARERGLGFLSLMVTEDNVAARELYAQAGYRTERRLLCKTL
jgi:ribosomal protein S18 acetylase RimI-like enzyme